MDAGRLENVLSLARAFEKGESQLPAGPVEAYIEVAARCNLRCPMCPIVVDPRHAPGSGQPALMAPDLFERLGPTFRNLQRAHLFGLGEPLLSPHLHHYVSRLFSAGVETWITTNATLMTEGRADALARAGLFRATVSMDGATKETYERIRLGGRFEDAVRGIRALAQARRRWGRPRVLLAMVGMASNLRELPQLADLAAQCGADGLFVEKLYHYPHPDLERVYAREDLVNLAPEETERIYAEAESRARHYGLEFSYRALPGRNIQPPAGPRPPRPEVSAPARLPALPFPCSEPWKTINVSAAGEVRTCCFNDTSFGNVASVSFEEIWNGDRYRRIRSDHAAGRTPFDCRQCVESGRVMRSPLFPASFPLPESGGAGSDELDLASPWPGEPVGRELVIAGSVRERETPFSRRFVDVFIDSTRVARLRARGFRGRFAAAISIPYVTEGHHVLRLRLESGGRPPATIERPIQVAWLDLAGGDGAAVTRAAICVELRRREGAPAATVGDTPWPVADWFCVPAEDGFLGIAILEVGALPAGPHDVELALRRRRERRTLQVVRIPAGDPRAASRRQAP